MKVRKRVTVTSRPLQPQVQGAGSTAEPSLLCMLYQRAMKHSLPAWLSEDVLAAYTITVESISRGIYA